MLSDGSGETCKDLIMEGHQRSRTELKFEGITILVRAFSKENDYIENFLSLRIKWAGEDDI